MLGLRGFLRMTEKDAARCDCGDAKCKQQWDLLLHATTNIHSETAARIREFLAASDDMPDHEPMWVVNGIVLTWGDLRVLADFGSEG